MYRLSRTERVKIPPPEPLQSLHNPKQKKSVLGPPVPEGLGKKKVQRRFIYLRILHGSLKYFITFFYSTPPLRKECRGDLKYGIANMGKPKCQPAFGLSLPPAKAVDVGILTKAPRSLTAIARSNK